MKSFQQYNQGDRLSATDYNNLVRELERKSKLFAAPPLYVTDGSYGTTLTYSDGQFWATICSYIGEEPGDGIYYFKEVVADSGGTFRILKGGREGIVYQVNGFTIYPGNVIRVYPGFGGEFITNDSPVYPPNIPILCDTPPTSSSSGSSSHSSLSSSSGSSSLSSSSYVPVSSSSSSGTVECIFCPDGTDLPSNVSLTISSAPVVSGTYPHDYTVLNGTYSLTQGYYSGTTIIPDSTANTWLYYDESITTGTVDGFYQCLYTTTQFTLTCNGSGVNYGLNGSIHKRTYASPSPIEDCTAHDPGPSAGEIWGITGTDRFTPSNNGNFGDGLASDGTPAYGTVALNTGDTCSPLYMSNYFTGQLYHIIGITFGYGTADNTSGTMVATLH